jgi:hypothetical protein
MGTEWGQRSKRKGGEGMGIGQSQLAELGPLALLFPTFAPSPNCRAKLKQKREETGTGGGTTKTTCLGEILGK